MDMPQLINNIILIIYMLVNLLNKTISLPTTVPVVSLATTVTNQPRSALTTDIATNPTDYSTPQNEYDYMIVQHGDPCARIAFRGYLEVRYHAADHLVKEYSSSVPSRASFTGQCNENATTLQLSWQPADFSLTFQFEKKAETWVIREVQTRFNLTSHVFDRSTGSAIQTVRSEPGMEYTETPLGNAYTCSGEESLDLKPYNGSVVNTGAAVHSVKLAMRQLSFQPFLLPQNGSFSEGFQCSMDAYNETSSTVVPTVVAILLSVIVLLILVSYSVYNKYNSRTPYVSMD